MKGHVSENMNVHSEVFLHIDAGFMMSYRIVLGSGLGLRLGLGLGS